MQQIECDDCHQWYHYSCVKLSPREARRDDSYICPVCTVTFSYLRSQDRCPPLELLDHFLQEGLALAIMPDEVPQLKEIVDYCTAFQEEVDEFLETEGDVDVAYLKNLSRCAEGLDVIVEPALSDLRSKIMEFTNHHKTEENQTYCICKGDYHPGRPMVCCDKCDEWFHYDCMNLTSEEANNLDGFLCPGCKPQPAPKIRLKVPTVSNEEQEQEEEEEEEEQEEEAQEDQQVQEQEESGAEVPPPPVSVQSEAPAPVPEQPVPEPVLANESDMANTKRKRVATEFYTDVTVKVQYFLNDECSFVIEKPTRYYTSRCTHVL